MDATTQCKQRPGWKNLRGQIQRPGVGQDPPETTAGARQHTGVLLTGECACVSLWWLLPSRWQWFIPFSLCLEKNLILCKPSCLWIFLSIHPFIWDPGHDNSYSNCGMLIRWKNVHISYLHFNWEIWLRYIICFNVICVRILKGWQYITALDKRRGIKGEGTIHGNMDFRILIRANICFSMGALNFSSYFLVLMPKVICFLLLTLK